MNEWLVKNIIRPKWVVYHTRDGLEIGIQIFGVVIGCYKGEILISHEHWGVRTPEKRELGETLLVPKKAA